jgi:hypothetical protein
MAPHRGQAQEVLAFILPSAPYIKKPALRRFFLFEVFGRTRTCVGSTKCQEHFAPPNGAASQASAGSACVYPAECAPLGVDRQMDCPISRAIFELVDDFIICCLSSL